MKDNNSSVVANWNYVTLSLVVVSILTVLVLYMPGLREVDIAILKATRKFLGQFPSYIPLAVTDFGRANWMLWPQIPYSNPSAAQHCQSARSAESAAASVPPTLGTC